MTRIKQILPSVAVISLLIAVWWVVVVASGSVIFPTPWQVMTGTIELIEDGTLWRHIGASLLRVGAGFLLAVGLALPLGLWMGWVRGAFVTLKKRGELRGCVGYIEPELPLFKTVIQASILAATKDDRFLPVEVAELERLKIEISVLTLPRPIKDINEIEIGRHGIIIQGIRKGVFLPQVPTEFGWDRETYLSQCCLHKAYLPPDAWKKGANIEVFEAQVFSE